MRGRALYLWAMLLGLQHWFFFFFFSLPCLFGHTDSSATLRICSFRVHPCSMWWIPRVFKLLMGTSLELGYRGFLTFPERGSYWVSVLRSKKVHTIWWVDPISLKVKMSCYAPHLPHHVLSCMSWCLFHTADQLPLLRISKYLFLKLEIVANGRERRSFLWVTAQTQIIWP